MGKAEQITGAQVRMARAFLRWSVADLAEKAGVGNSTVQRIEAAENEPPVVTGLQWRVQARDRSLAAIQSTLIAAGTTFLPDDGNGVGVRGKLKAR